MNKLAILIPFNPNVTDELKQEIREVLQKNLSIRDVPFDGVVQVRENLFVYMDANAPNKPSVIKCHRDRALYIAKIRDGFIDRFRDDFERKGITHVLWHDADVIRFPEWMFDRLWELSIKEKAITAPCVLLDNIKAKGTCHPLRWYDTAGFIHNKCMTETEPPWFNGMEWPLPDVVELNGSIGCVYCVPWVIYKEGGVKHEWIEIYGKQFTEHYPICQVGRQMGYKLLVDTKIRAYHAFFPAYKEIFH